MTRTELLNELDNRGIAYESKVINKDGINVEGIVVGDGNIRPTIYPYQYENVSNITVFVDMIEDKIEEGLINIDANRIASWDYVKDNIYIVALPKKDMSDVITMDYLDLMLMFRVRIETEEDGEVASYKVNNNMLATWGVTFSDMFKAAKENTGKMAEVISMIDMLAKQMNMPKEQLEMMMPSEDDSLQLMVVTNNQRMYGAGAIVNSEVFEDISRKIGTNKLIIIPSSIHELLIFDGGAIVDNDLSSMIQDVNKNLVAENKILSNHPYVWTKNKEVEILNI